MRFISYWIISIMFAVWAAMEKLMAGIGKGMMGRSMLAFWILIGLAFFFLLCAYGSMIEDKGKNQPPADDNPF
jgi:hypothetical protein